MKNTSAKSVMRRESPAFLSEIQRGLNHVDLTTTTRPTPTPRRHVGRPLDRLQRLTAEIGLVLAGHENATLEILPGAPTTIAISADGELISLMVLPLDAEQASHVLGVPPTPARDRCIEHLWEEQRQLPVWEP
jgi:hypothetical protein